MLKTALIFFSLTNIIFVLCTDAVSYNSHSYSESTSFQSEKSSELKCDIEDRKDPTDCTGPYEYFESCASDFDSDDSLCIVGCQCIDNYVRNEDGICFENVDQCSENASTSTIPETTTSTPSKVNADDALSKIWQGNEIFTLKFLKIKTIKSPKESFIISAFSVLFPLAQLALYAIGNTFQQLANILNVYNTDEIRQGFKMLLDNFKVEKNVTLSLAQRIYGNIQYDFTPNFKYDTKYYFEAEAENLDFSQSKQAADIINNWVKNQTNGLITNLVNESLLSALTRLVLVNAIYFKGNWLRPFNPERTEQKDFYVTKDTKTTVNMMFQEGRFKYIENNTLQVKALELIYKDPDYSFLCLLPTTSDTYSLEGLAEYLQDPEIFRQILDSLVYEKVRVLLPSYQTATTTDLSEILTGLNVTEVFNPNNSEISGILEQPETLFISAAIQKSVVDVNELGSEAAAANAIVVGTTSIDITPPKNFEANRSFFYFILYKRNIIFCGSYKGT